MRTSEAFGRLLQGSEDLLEQSYRQFDKQRIDLDWLQDPNEEPLPLGERHLAGEASLRGPGTFFGKAERNLTLGPARNGWWFNRSDLPDDLATKASVRNVWTTGSIVSNIVLRSGAPNNYVRMVEHTIALRLGLSLDHAMVSIDSGDPPLFNRGSLDLIDAAEQAGIVETGRPARFVTVKEPVSIVSPNGSFLVLRPCEGPLPRLTLDCAVDFPTFIGKQRLRFAVTPATFTTGAEARTNTSASKRLYCQTLGRLFADIRNLGYTNDNILVAAKNRYLNTPRLMHDGVSLEAVWHRAALDLLAALALIDTGRFVGHVESYKAGHRLDVNMVTQLFLHELLVDFIPR